MEFTKELTCWENRDITVRPVMTYIYLCGKVMPSLYRLFANLPSVTVRDLN